MNTLETKLPELTMTGNGIRLLYSGTSYTHNVLQVLQATFVVHAENTVDSCEAYLKDQSLFNLPDVIIIEVTDPQKCFNFIDKIKKDPLLKGLIIILLGDDQSQQLRKTAMSHKVNDLYLAPVPVKDLCERIVFLVKFKLIKPQLSDLSKIDINYKIPFYKRAFDVLASGSALLMLSPLLIAVATAVALESRGPVIFKSKRVGTGYHIFDFYKFRSMRNNANKELDSLSNLNQYDKTEGGQTTFVKLKNDPRVTKIGAFIRKYSIDELPQLYNVFKGDMS
ncbi:sugar transferase, partial [Pedobacter sp.]|uniref:sugar transferase n=1 Tax=Pedobacter sp. TaxID=1411316 RepID=UPI003D7F92B0